MQKKRPLIPRTEKSVKRAGDSYIAKYNSVMASSGRQPLRNNSSASPSSNHCSPSRVLCRGCFGGAIAVDSHAALTGGGQGTGVSSAGGV